MVAGSSGTKSTRPKLRPPAHAPTTWRALKRLSTRHWRDAIAFYERNKSRLVKDPRYRNRFVAIRYGKIVDVDDDKLVLSDRLRERFPDQIYIVHQVLRHEPVIHMNGVVAE